MVTNGPTAGVEPSGCLNASGAVSVMANTGFVILIDLGRPGTLRSGSEALNARPFNWSAFEAVLSNIEWLIVPTTGITFELCNPPEDIKELMLSDLWISRSAMKLNPAFKV